jgi:hypothetical protein
MRALVAIGIAVILGLVVWSLMPSIVIAPGATDDPHDPLATNFIATNRSIYALHDVHYVCLYQVKGAATGLGESDAHITHTHTLITGESLNLHCDFRDADRSASHVVYATVVYYKLPMRSTEFSNGSMYQGQRDADGNVQWVPDGAGMDGQETFRRSFSYISSPWTSPAFLNRLHSKH